MEISDLELKVSLMNTPFSMFRASVTVEEWESTALSIAENHGRLITLWASEKRAGKFVVSVVYEIEGGQLLWLDLALARGVGEYPDISTFFPAAIRMQRAMRDLLGIQADGATDSRPWLDHGAWPEGYFPLRKEPNSNENSGRRKVDDYEFVPVSGDGVHEIAVGPVHAGIIEPGHFRFSVVGEKTLRLEERLGYAHKGVDKAFERFAAEDGYKLAGRMSGDSTVAYSWSYCMGLENIRRCKVPKRALWLRAVVLERERIGNHLGDLGAIGNDAGFAFGLSQFMRLREDWLRLNKMIFSHRLMMDYICPGGVEHDVNREELGQILAQCKVLEKEVRILQEIYDDHSGLQDRFLTTGTVSNELAKALGLTGLAGRASGIMRDVRTESPSAPYTEFLVNISTRTAGDVAARVDVRFDEIFESLRLIRSMVGNLPDGEFFSESIFRGPGGSSGSSAGWIEGWRGGIFSALEIDSKGKIARCHIHDPSWQNWPVIEYAVIGDIVPDFPLINKSFNLSYSGHDR
jgi:Ni,Fe-hydrogenase III large subunit/Ni,Fe-hydrogenase III component G